MPLGQRRLRIDRPTEPLPLTPLLDIIFLVTIFFVLTAGTVIQQAIEVDLPAATTAQSSPADEEWSLQVDHRGQVRFRGETYPAESLGPVLDTALTQGEDPHSITITLAASRRLPYGTLMQVMDTLRSRGLLRIALLTLDKDGP